MQALLDHGQLPPIRDEALEVLARLCNTEPPMAALTVSLALSGIVFEQQLEKVGVKAELKDGALAMGIIRKQAIICGRGEVEHIYSLCDGFNNLSLPTEWDLAVDGWAVSKRTIANVRPAALGLPAASWAPGALPRPAHAAAACLLTTTAAGVASWQAAPRPCSCWSAASPHPATPSCSGAVQADLPVRRLLERCCGTPTICCCSTTATSLSSSALRCTTPWTSALCGPGAATPWGTSAWRPCCSWQVPCRARASLQRCTPAPTCGALRRRQRCACGGSGLCLTAQHSLRLHCVRSTDRSLAWLWGFSRLPSGAMCVSRDGR